MRKDRPYLAAVFAITAALIFAVMGLIVKTLGEEIPNGMIIFFRQLFCLMLLTTNLPALRRSTGVKTKRFSLHLLRALSSLGAMYCLYYALKHLPLVDALLLSYTRPLFIPIIVYFTFGKKWGRFTWVGLGLGFFGVLFLLKPGQMAFDAATIIGLGSGLFGAIAFTTIRRLTKYEPPNRIMLYYLLLSLPIAGIFLTQQWTAPTWKIWGTLVLIGALTYGYQHLLTRAYMYAKAYKVAALLYTTVIFGVILEFFMGGKMIDIYSWLGILLILGGSLLLLKEESKSSTTKKS